MRKYHKQEKLVERIPKNDLQRQGLAMKELLDLYFPMPQVTVSNSGNSAKAVSPPVDIPQLTLHMIWTDVVGRQVPPPLLSRCPASTGTRRPPPPCLVAPLRPAPAAPPHGQDDYGELLPYENFGLESNSIAEAEPPSPFNIEVIGSDLEAPSRQATPNPPLELSSSLSILDSEPDLPTVPVAINRKVCKSQKEIRQHFSNSVLLQNSGQGTT